MSGISGFPEWLPQQQMLWESWKDLIEGHFKAHGFVSLETPVVERLETLLAKGNDHEIYGLCRLSEDHRKPELGLRFDLTVPLARYVAQHHGKLIFPYRRYHIAPVWRGERPQEGRYRQFYQCDIDIIGQNQLSSNYDSEVAWIMWSLLEKLHMADSGVILINHRKILSWWLSIAGIMQSSGDALKLIDKRGKLPFEEIILGLEKLGASSYSLEVLNQWIQPALSWKESIEALSSLSQETPFVEAIKELEAIIHLMQCMGVPEQVICVDPLLARGLTYYSGTIYEMILKAHPTLGAVCAGGRYDQLASSFSKQSLPGVGLSLGLSRLFSVALTHLSEAKPLTFSHLLVTVQQPSYLVEYLSIGSHLRKQGWNIEVYLDQHELGAQLKYANRKGFPVVIIANQQELDQGQVQLKNMLNGHQVSINISDISSILKEWGLSPLAFNPNG